jgi:hypothetical protein
VNGGEHVPTPEVGASDDGELLSRVLVGLYVICLGVGVVAYTSYYLVTWLSSQRTEDKLASALLQVHLISFAVMCLISTLLPPLWLARSLLRSLSRRLRRRV